MLPLAAPAQAAEWTHGLEAAEKQAAAENKLVPVEFTGSGRYTRGIQLNRQILSTAEFAAFIAPLFVPVQMIDGSHPQESTHMVNSPPFSAA